MEDSIPSPYQLYHHHSLDSKTAMLHDTAPHYSSHLPPHSPPPSPPIRPRSSLLDDIFSTSRSPSPANRSTPPNAHHTSNHTSEPSDIPRLRAQHVTSGYREGIAASRTATLQGGFDEGYSLGAVIGLRVGWMIGVLEGIDAALRGGTREKETTTGAAAEKVKTGTLKGVAPEERKDNKSLEVEVEHQPSSREKEEAEVRVLLKRGRQELDLTHIFGPQYWGEDGVWKYEVQSIQEDTGKEEEVTFSEVADQHPLLKAWKEEISRLMRKWGVNDKVWEGEEWEKGRVG